MAALAAAIAGIGLAAGSGVADSWDALAVASGSVGAVAAGLYLFGANGAADEATQRMRRRQ